LLLDDYGHHPEEIKAVFAAIREGWSNRRIIIVFQPHRYSRTQQLFMDFVNVLPQADRIILLDIYSQDNSHHFNNYRGQLPMICKSEGLKNLLDSI
jgi:UDP-N-acetylmuramate--alanine ligase